MTVDHLRLTLPAGFERRADAIARRVADELALLPSLGPARLERLEVPPLTLDPGLSDRQIAHEIAGEIRTAIHGRVAASHGGRR